MSYFEARYLNTSVGKFNSLDPVFLNPDATWLADPQAQNAYAYARNNPLRYNDPDGKFAFFVPAAYGVYLTALVVATVVATAVTVAVSAVTDAVLVPAYSESAIFHSSESAYIESYTGGQSLGAPGTYIPDRPMPGFDNKLKPILDPEVEGPHTQLGNKVGRKGTYGKGREIDANGDRVKDIDFTDHGRPKNHENPHQHPFNENKTGGSPSKGEAEPLAP